MSSLAVPQGAARRRSAASFPRVAVVIPVYRDAAHIGGVLASIPASVSVIVVVDDASPDETAEVVSAQRDPRVHYVRHETNCGVGGAMLTGYRQAARLGAEILVKMDADGQMDAAQLPRLIAPIVNGDADYTKGNRFLHAPQLAAMPPLRRIGNMGLSFLAKLASGYWDVFDPTNGYTAIHASVLPMINQDALDPRFFFETSMLVELSMCRAVVRDVPMPARYRGEMSSLSESRAFVSFPPRLIRSLVRRVVMHHFVQDFGLFALFLVSGLLLSAFGAGFGAWAWIVNAHRNVETSAGTVMIAVLPIILGIQLLLQALTLDIQSTPVHPVHHSLEDEERPGSA